MFSSRIYMRSIKIPEGLGGCPIRDAGPSGHPGGDPQRARKHTLTPSTRSSPKTRRFCSDLLVSLALTPRFSVDRAEHRAIAQRRLDHALERRRVPDSKRCSLKNRLFWACASRIRREFSAIRLRSNARVRPPQLSVAGNGRSRGRALGRERSVKSARAHAQRVGNHP